jgi:type II secretory pathway pseudopilin PulG
MDLRARIRTDAGETLVEVLAALSILSIAAVAILTGLQVSIKSSDFHRKEATGGAYVRSFAEAIQNYVDTSGYKSCASAASTYESVAVPTLPSGYVKKVTAVQSWTGTAWGACTADGIQRLDLEVTSSGDDSHRATEKLTVILRQPCNGPATVSGSNPCAP